MKKAVIFFIMFFALTAHAEIVQITFGWEHPEPETVKSYGLYWASQSGGPWALAIEFTGGSNFEGDYERVVSPGESVYFVMDAEGHTGKRSGYSEEVAFFLPNSGGGTLAAPGLIIKGWRVLSGQ